MRKRVTSLYMALAIGLSLLLPPVLAVELPEAVEKPMLDAAASIHVEDAASAEEAYTVAEEADIVADAADIVAEEADIAAEEDGEPSEDTAPAAAPVSAEKPSANEEASDDAASDEEASDEEKTDEEAWDEETREGANALPPAEALVDAEEETDAVLTEAFSSGLDDGDLLMYYLEREAGALPEATLMAEAGDRLSGFEKAVYQELMTAVKEVAAGTRQSTQFMLNLDALGYPQMKSVSKDSWASILHCLMADCPYDFYWYGRASTWRVSGSYFYCGLRVSKYYAAGEYQVKSGLASLLSTVQSNTNAIVNKYAGKSDYEKLKAYKDEICGLVKYNDDAAEFGSSAENSNPWELIYVFDGNPNTNVVCEGYAKAFQFLCDLSSFKDSAFACYYVKGWFSSDGTTNKGGRHGWNHVTLGGKTYLTDVTHCDNDDGTYDDSRFMRPALPGYNTPATGYTIYLTGTTAKAWYLDIDYYQLSRGKDHNENIYEKDAPFLTLSTTPCPAAVQNSLSFSPNSVTVQVAKEQEVIISCANDNFSYWSYKLSSKNGIVSVAWGAADKKTATSHSLLVTGLKAGTETVKVLLLDSDKNEIASNSFSVIVTPAAEKHKVTIIDGTGSGEYEEGSTVIISAHSAPAGCKIWGWYGPGASKLPLTFFEDSLTQAASFTMPDYDVTFRALYSYTVTLIPNGGELEQSSQELRFSTDKVYLETYDLPEPKAAGTRAGHTFQGWYTQKIGGDRVENGAEPSKLANHTLYAHWKNSEYALSLSPASVDILEGESQTVTVTYSNNDFAYFSHNGAKSTVISAKWGSQNQRGSSIPLTITGLSAGQETLKISLLDDDDNALISESLSVNVRKKDAKPAAVKSVSRIGDTVIANITCTDDSASMYCVFYNDTGRMISMCSAKVTGLYIYLFQSEGQQFDYAKVFLLDENLCPLCEGKKT